ncbi:unnamed protein product [Tuber aestivum]|uniref:CorA-like transporter domain-containing protein n=1 Tax=Tuber aestivum TaxID=59557 RepID=A0A292PXF8_9PEZI|nr:unnamed protein product [Tuber aestivum]
MHQNFPPHLSLRDHRFSMAPSSSIPMIPPSCKNLPPQLAPTQAGLPIASQQSKTAKAQAPSFQGWEKYPLMLTDHNTLGRDGSVFLENLRNDSERLFYGPERASLGVLDVLEAPDPNCPPGRKKDQSQKLSVFAWKLTLTSTITPSFSWAKLPITEEMLQKLLTFYKVSPDFLRLVHIFGRRRREWIPSSDVFRRLLKAKGTHPNAYISGILSSKPAQESPALTPPPSEICIRMAHVEKHGRPDTDELGRDPWSVRQFGCYQRFDYEDDSSVCIHIMPPESVKSRLAEALTRGRFSQESEHLSPVSLPLGFVTTAMQNWRSYVGDLESELIDCGKCVYLTDEEWEKCRTGKADLKTRYSHLRKLQRQFRDKLLNTISNFSLNINVLEGLQAHVIGLQSVGLLSDAAYKDASDILEHNTSVLRDLLRDTERMLEKTSNAVQLIQAQFEIRNDTLIHNHTMAVGDLVNTAQTQRTATGTLVDIARTQRCATGTLVAMAEGNQKDTQTMVAFADLTKRDSRTMRVATMLATLYLPGTFVATMFGMNVFHSDIEFVHEKKVYTFTVAAQAWIFGVTVVALTAVTVTSFWLWERRLRRKDEGRRIPPKDKGQGRGGGAGAVGLGFWRKYMNRKIRPKDEEKGSGGGLWQKDEEKGSGGGFWQKDEAKVVP